MEAVAEVDLDAERAAARARIDAKDLRARARWLLNRVGFRSSLGELVDAAAQHWSERGQEWRTAVVKEAMRLQRDEEDSMVEPTAPIEPPSPAELLAWIRDRLLEDIEVPAGVLYERARRELGITLKQSTFQTTYFYKVRPDVQRELRGESPPPATPRMDPEPRATEPRGAHIDPDPPRIARADPPTSSDLTTRLQLGQDTLEATPLPDGTWNVTTVVHRVTAHQLRGILQWLTDHALQEVDDAA